MSLREGPGRKVRERERERHHTARGRDPTTSQLQAPSKQSCVPSVEFSMRERLNACPSNIALLHAVRTQKLLFISRDTQQGSPRDPGRHRRGAT